MAVSGRGTTTPKLWSTWRFRRRTGNATSQGCLQAAETKLAFRQQIRRRHDTKAKATPASASLCIEFHLIAPRLRKTSHDKHCRAIDAFVTPEQGVDAISPCEIIYRGYELCTRRRRDIHHKQVYVSDQVIKAPGIWLSQANRHRWILRGDAPCVFFPLHISLKYIFRL